MALLLVGHAFGASAQPAPDDPDPLFARAIERHQAGDIIGAIEAYQEVLDQMPLSVEARSNLGAALVHLGRYDEGIEHYRLALEVADGSTPVRFNLGLALYKAARIADAAAELAQVVAADAAHMPARMILADCYLQMGRNRDVIDLLAPLEAEMSHEPAFAYVLGTALIHEDEVERGQMLVDRVFRGDSAEGRLLMGIALLQRENFPDALDELSRAVTLNPSLPGVHSYHGRALMGAGDQPSAARAFLRELEQNPNDFEANLYLGNMRQREQKYEEAFAYLQRAHRMRAHDLRVLHNLGSLFLATGRAEEAREALESVIEQAPDFVEAHVLLAITYYRLKRKEDGDRHRAIVDRLNAEIQAKEPGSRPRSAHEQGPPQ